MVVITQTNTAALTRMARLSFSEIALGVSNTLLEYETTLSLTQNLRVFIHLAQVIASNAPL